MYAGFLFLWVLVSSDAEGNSLTETEQTLLTKLLKYPYYKADVLPNTTATQVDITASFYVLSAQSQAVDLEAYVQLRWTDSRLQLGASDNDQSSPSFATAVRRQLSLPQETSDAERQYRVWTPTLRLDGLAVEAHHEPVLTTADGSIVVDVKYAGTIVCDIRLAVLHPFSEVLCDSVIDSENDNYISLQFLVRTTTFGQFLVRTVLPALIFAALTATTVFLKRKSTKAIVGLHAMLGNLIMWLHSCTLEQNRLLYTLTIIDLWFGANLLCQACAFATVTVDCGGATTKNRGCGDSSSAVVDETDRLEGIGIHSFKYANRRSVFGAICLFYAVFVVGYLLLLAVVV